MVTVRGPWHSDLRDRDDNWIITSQLTAFYPDHLKWLNRAPYDVEDPLADRVVTAKPGNLEEDPEVGNPARIRASLYEIRQPFAGSQPMTTGGIPCALDHSDWGDRDFQYWNGSWTDFNDPSSPICKPLPGGFIDTGEPIGGYGYLDYDASMGSVLGAGEVTANEDLGVRGIWVGNAKDQLPVGGMFDPVYDSTDIWLPELPDFYSGPVSFEWDGELELVKVEVTGDRPNRSEDVDRATDILGNDLYALPYNEGSPGQWSTQWPLGRPGSPNTVTGDEYVSITYQNGDPVWTEFTSITSWDDCRDPITERPDINCILKVNPLGDTEGVSYRSNVEPAVRLTFRAPRWRIVYEVENPEVPVRKAPRKDGFGYESATRALATIPRERHIAGDWD